LWLDAWSVLGHGMWPNNGCEAFIVWLSPPPQINFLADVVVLNMMVTTIIFRPHGQIVSTWFTSRDWWIAVLFKYYLHLLHGNLVDPSGSSHRKGGFAYSYFYYHILFSFYLLIGTAALFLSHWLFIILRKSSDFLCMWKEKIYNIFHFKKLQDFVYIL
jgi:hypothetical protein